MNEFLGFPLLFNFSHGQIECSTTVTVADLCINEEKQLIRRYHFIGLIRAPEPRGLALIYCWVGPDFYKDLQSMNVYPALVAGDLIQPISQA